MDDARECPATHGCTDPGPPLPSTRTRTYPCPRTLPLLFLSLTGLFLLIFFSGDRDSKGNAALDSAR